MVAFVDNPTVPLSIAIATSAAPSGRSLPQEETGIIKIQVEQSNRYNAMHTFSGGNENLE